jgi:hypothetical protein
MATWAAAIVGSALIIASAAAEPLKPVDVTVNPGRYGPYYHVRYGLTAAAIDFQQSDRSARGGGQFELRVRASRFPIAAPRCRRWIILRMPWTAPSDAGAAEKIAAKVDLLHRIQALRSAPKDVLPVTLELNPYVKAVEHSPLRLELTECNVFFRHRLGAYVDSTGPAAPIERR